MIGRQLTVPTITTMVARERAADRGTRRGLDSIRAIGGEIRLARTRAALSIAAVAREVGISAAELSRIERGRAEWVSVVTLARVSAVVGLDLSVRAFPGGSPMRDAPQARILSRLRPHVHVGLAWRVEVPLPGPGEQRAWDAMIRGSGWRFGVEAELNPTDGQALIRRLMLKMRDGMVDGVILLLPDTRQSRAFRREFADLLRDMFPVSSAAALRCLSEGLKPEGNAIIVL